MNEAADITRLGMFSARALPIVSLCHIDPSRKDPALCGETSHTPETFSLGNDYGTERRLIHCSRNVVLDTEARLARTLFWIRRGILGLANT